MKTLGLKLLILGLLIIALIFPFSIQVQAVSTDNSCSEGMIFIHGGTFNIGSDTHYESEKSASDVTVDSFCIDRHEVTNAEFRQFVEATGYQTIAERPLPKEQFPNLTDEQRDLTSVLRIIVAAIDPPPENLNPPIREPLMLVFAWLNV